MKKAFYLITIVVIAIFFSVSLNSESDKSNKVSFLEKSTQFETKSRILNLNYIQSSGSIADRSGNILINGYSAYYDPGRDVLKFIGFDEGENKVRLEFEIRPDGLFRRDTKELFKKTR